LSGSPTWTQLQPTGTPPLERLGQVAIYDPVGDRMIVFGGYKPSYNYGYFNDTWALSFGASSDGTWLQLSPTGPPSGREGMCGVYDAPRQRMLLLGRPNGTGTNNDVWALTLSGPMVWTPVSAPCGASPSPRWFSVGVYDDLNDRLVIHGTYSTTIYGDVWALPLDGESGWSELTPSGGGPGPRYAHTATWDPLAHRMLLFAGWDGTQPYNDVWALEVSPPSGAWSLIAAGATPPTPRDDHAAAYDVRRNRLLVFGGYEPVPLGETWALSLSGSPLWTPVSLPPALPSPRCGHSLTYDPLRDRLVLFGGYGSSSALNDTWALPFRTMLWEPLATSGTPPSPRYDHGAIYDPVRDRMLVLSGVLGGNEVWALSLGGAPVWSRLETIGSVPYRVDFSTVYDPIRDRVLRYSGLWQTFCYHEGCYQYCDDYAQEVGALSLSGTPARNLLVPAGTPPDAREGHRAVYDSTGDRVIVFGGMNDVNTY
jgi:hypothetical protein